MSGEGHHDIYLDVFDDETMTAYSSRSPDVRYEVTNMMDSLGEETDDPEDAIAGVVKISEHCFVVFTMGRKL